MGQRPKAEEPWIGISGEKGERSGRAAEKLVVNGSSSRSPFRDLDGVLALRFLPHIHDFGTHSSSDFRSQQSPFFAFFLPGCGWDVFIHIPGFRAPFSFTKDAFLINVWPFTRPSVASLVPSKPLEGT